MFTVMSDHFPTGPQDPSQHGRFRERLDANRDRDAEEIGDWMNGNGGLVVAIIAVALVGWFLYGLVAG